MSGKARPSLRKKALDDVKHSNMSKAVKECIAEVFERYEMLENEMQFVRQYIHDNGLEWDLLTKYKKAMGVEL